MIYLQNIEILNRFHAQNLHCLNEMQTASQFCVFYPSDARDWVVPPCISILPE